MSIYCKKTTLLSTIGMMFRPLVLENITHLPLMDCRLQIFSVKIMD